MRDSQGRFISARECLEVWCDKLAAREGLQIQWQEDLRGPIPVCETHLQLQFIDDDLGDARHRPSGISPGLH